MPALPYQPDLALRMTLGTEERIPVTAEFFATENGYHIAWLGNGKAFVLAPDAPDNEPADEVEGLDNAAELIDMIESGAYADITEFEGSEEEWQALAENMHNHH